MSLTVPKAPIIGIRAARVQVAENQTGDAVAQLGMTMLQVGEKIAAEKDQRGLGRARVQAMTELNDLQLKHQQVGDPDQIDSGWAQDLEALRQRVLSNVPESMRDRVGLMVDEMAAPHAARLGAHAIELRHGQELATLSAAGNELVRTAATADPETQAAYRAQFEDQLGSAVARGIMSPQDAEKARQNLGIGMETARAQRMLSEDPDALVASVDAGEFGALGGDQAQGWRARGLAAAQENAARIAAEGKRDRAERIGAARDLFRDGAAVLRKGQPFAGDVDAVTLMTDPEIAALPEAREYLATVQLSQSKPGLAVMPLGDKRKVLADLEKQAISKPYEADKVDALRKMIADDEKGFAEDPITYAGELGLKPATALPDPANATDADMITGLRARRNYAAALTQSGYTSKPSLFTEKERQAWSKLVAPDAPPEIRARLAQQLATAMGPTAEDAAVELGADPVFALIGGGLANGLPQATARQVFDGQRVIEGQQVKLPAKAERRQAFFGQFNGLFFDGTVQGWPDQSGIRDQISGAADALYAWRMRAAQASGDGQDGQIEETTYLQAVHEVMGGAGEYNSSTARGGVQEVRDQLTILPAGISADDVEDRLSALANGGEKAWASIAIKAGAPQVGGELPDARSARRMQIRAVGPDQYMMVWPNPSTGALTVLMNDQGDPFVVSMRKLMELGAK